MNNLLFSLYLLLFSFGLSELAFSQIERGGTPPSFAESVIKLRKTTSVFEVTPPDLQLLQQQDAEAENTGRAYRIGVEVATTFNTDNAGEWTTLTNGAQIWQLHLKCNGAQAIGLVYDKITIPDGACFFVYTPNRAKVIGAFTNKELNGETSFVTRPLLGDQCVVEYYAPKGLEAKPQIEISAITYVYRGIVAKNKTDFSYRAKSNPCEVNVNCKEGTKWQKQKQGVLKIFTTAGKNNFLCSASLINNTRRDFQPYVLSAYHCSFGIGNIIASTEELKKWIFYFNYETPDCNSAVEPKEQTMLGAEKIANSNANYQSDSDFLLLKMLSDVPLYYTPYFNGWDLSEEPSNSGVGIHHPYGDVKKISTYTTQLRTSAYTKKEQAYWSVTWAKTDNGHGITEQGSSGSPLFNDKGLIVGTLTGGTSYCDTPLSPDSYGRFSYHWDKNGITQANQLKPWLDPLSTGKTSIVGTFHDNDVVAYFTQSKTLIYTGQTIDFRAECLGEVKTWEWEFEGASPATSSSPSPKAIRYNKTGTFKVLLRVKGANSADTISSRVMVKHVAYPNPTTDGVVNIIADDNLLNNNEVTIDVFDVQGSLINQYKFSTNLKKIHQIKLPKSSNIYILRIKQATEELTQKIIVLN